MADDLKLNFTRGEITPLLHARIDIDHYQAGLSYMRNWVPLRYGGMTRAPGSVLRGFAKHGDRTARFLPFIFNRAQAYAIEAGHQYFRFWNRDTQARVESPPGTPVEVATPYDEDDLKYIQVRQSGDLVFIFCRGYWPHVLTRNSETSWTLAAYAPDDGPYLDINLTSTTLDPSATSGTGTITASSTTGINGGAGFQDGDVGRVIRYLEAGGRWYWFVITGRSSSTVVNVTYMGRDDGNTAAMPGHAASANWRLGAWCAYEGYPRAVGMHEERLVSASTALQPTTVWTTVAQDTGLNDYSIQSPLVDDDAVTAKMLGSLSSVEWIADGTDIILGTEGSIRVLGRADPSKAFGPANVQPQRETEVPASYVPGFFVERYLLFVDEYRRQLYEATYVNEAQGLVAQEISALNEHLLNFGVTSLAFQRTPNRTLWMTTDEGTLLAATYDRPQEVFGVSRVRVGGDGVVEWVMQLPGIDRDGDQVWMLVRRTINGNVVRTIETLAAFWREGVSAQEQPIYCYCAGVYDGAATNVVTGLEDFEGETFGVLADGADLGDATVEDGELYLPNGIEASVVVYGFRQSSLGRTLRLSSTETGAPTLGRPSLASSASLDLYQTGPIRVGMGQLTEEDYDNGLDILRPEDIAERDPYAAYALRTGTETMNVDDSWSNHGVCTIESDSMLPATVRAIIAEMEAGD